MMELSQIDSDNMRDVTTAVYGHNPLVEHILQEHKFLDHLFKVYEELPTDTPADQKLKLGWEMIRQISMHAATEEMVLYPAVAKLMGDGAGDQLVDETQAVKEVLAQLNNINNQHDHSLQELVAKTIQMTREHIQDEEQNFLPRLSELASPWELNRLARQFEAARGAAPTRPHPYAPNKPPLNYFTNAAAMALDTARDAVRFGPGDLKTSVGQLKPTAMLSQG